MLKIEIILLLILCAYECSCDYNEGNRCIDDSGNSGICVKIQNCKHVLDRFKANGTRPIICSRNETTVCCDETKITDLYRTRQLCEPLVPARTNLSVGRIAYTHCVKYMDIPFPCEPVLSLGGNVVSRRNLCYEPPSLIIGSSGEDAERGEFAHMALLGFRDGATMKWLCGGSVISEQFILTAGHCTKDKLLGNVAVARLGILKRSDPENDYQYYNIKRAITHPDYKPPLKYNDVALLETEKKIFFLAKFIQPACLFVNNDGEEADFATATGWGELSHNGENADVLQKMRLQRFQSDECSTHYEIQRHLKSGLDNHTMLCYGHRELPRDTCRGDSGGPIQTKFAECMSSVIGVTSFGLSCGRTGQPGVYTRIYPYIPWIESIVWPGEN